jgi:outer membrane protein OmpA-like peptidoglycan-associated protein
MMITDNPEERISVEGHTDNIGNASYTVGLSERRAGAVVKYLTENGVAADRLETKGWGKTKPMVSNDDEIGGREINRRVEFVILEE